MKVKETPTRCVEIPGFILDVFDGSAWIIEAAATDKPCCTRCGEYLKPDRVPTGDLCGLCYDDARNGR